MENIGDEFYDLEDEKYRDSISTVDKSGKRIWIYPKMPKGSFYNKRKIVSYILLIVLFGLPFVRWNGEPFVLLNVIESKFILFGFPFTTQDFHIFVVGMLIAIVFIALFTVVFGRVFCGWICPQTIFMEMVFRRIEYWIEGDANAQKRLNKQAWTNEKIRKKAIKHLLFISISVIIAHTFLSYIIGIDELWKLLTDPISAHWSGFIAMIIFTLVFYGVFSVMREQVCTTICPYGRMQSVLLDKDSLAVSYDFVRGEPRGKLSRKKKEKEPIKKEPCDNGCSNCATDSGPCPSDKLATMFNVVEEKKGDCIDCNLCVQVCPTGIDIRNGTQLECVNCTACMDACDEVMVKIKKPEGLIRIDSYNGIVKGEKKIWNKRAIAYSIVLVLLVALESFMFISRSSVETLFLRTPGVKYQEMDEGYIGNLYNYQLINKTRNEWDLQFHVEGFDEAIFQFVGKEPTTIPNEVAEGAVFIKIPIDKLTSTKMELTIEVTHDGEIIDKTETTFFSPKKK